MAVSNPPPPSSEPPLSTTTTTTTITTTTTTARPRFTINPRPPHPPHQPPPSFYSTTPTPDTLFHRPPSSNPNPNYPRLISSHHPPHDSTATTSTTTAPISTAASILYPVASSGRGFVRQTQTVSSVAHSNSNLYLGRPVGVPSSYQRPSFGYSHPDPGLGQGTVYVTSVGNSTHLQQAGVVGSSAVKGAVVSAPFSQTQHKVTLPPTSVSNFNGHKDMRERSKDDAFVTVNDRKVRASDSASLYALCRSWLKNGFSEESQLQNLDAVRSLPRPLPLSAQDDASPTSAAEPEEVEQEVESVDNLSQKEMLQQHVKRAKRVRSRIREQRLRRIAPYKTRLALLLRPMVDSNLKNDLVTGETK